MKQVLIKLNQYLNRHELIIILFLLAVILRLPSLFEPSWYGDENIYLAIGQSIRHGDILYQDITDYPNKPPMIYLLAALVKNVFNFRLFLLFWNLANIAVIYLLVHTLTKHKLLSFLASFVFILLTSTPILEGNIANAEIFFILPTSLSVLLFFFTPYSKTSRLTPYIRYFLAGIFLGFAFLFKIHVLLDIAAIGIYFFIFSPLKQITPKSIKALIMVPHPWIFLGGMLLPVIITFFGLGLVGVSPLNLFKTAANSSGYVSVWSRSDWISQIIGFGSLQARTVLLAFLTLVLFLLRNKLKPPLLFLGLWLIFDLFAALLSARPYPHYLIQIIPPLIIGLAVLFHQKHLFSKGVFAGVLLLVLLAYIRFDFHFWSVRAYYQNFITYVRGQIDRTEYYARFDSRMPRNYALASYLRQTTTPNERIYIWGTEPELYVLSQRLPVGPLVVSFHVEDLNYYQPTIEALEADHSATVVIMENERRSFPELKSLLNTDYFLVKTIGDPRKHPTLDHDSRAQVYKRISKK